MESDLLSRENFPGVKFCFAYGSGAVFQDNYKKDDDKMLDLVFVVDDPLNWHKQNLENNPLHYASHMRAFGAGFITRVQEGYSAGMYYNTLVPMRSQPHRLMKYGVISAVELDRDLKTWHTLYLAGRLHKPVVFMSKPSEQLASTLRNNLSFALRTALYLLPEKFSKLELYLAIAGLSYSGDFRMIFGENPDKVKNIVKPNLHLFDNLYQNVLSRHSEYITTMGVGSDDGYFAQDKSPHMKQQLYSALPPLLLKSNGGLSVVESPDVIRSRLKAIVMRSSLQQSAKGIVTAGPMKSVNYTSAKISKWASGWAKRVAK
jgi:mitochondrial translocator assembly and maintenance protein 41